jgi:hypothetical protein
VDTETQWSSTAPVHFHIKVWKGWIGVDRQIGRATRRQSTGVPHHCCELQERIATQFVNRQLKIIEPGLDLSLRFLRIEDYKSVIPIHPKEAGIGELLATCSRKLRGHQVCQPH